MFDLATGLEGLLRGSAGVGVPVFNERAQGVAYLRHRHAKTQADGAAALRPVAAGPGGNHPSGFLECFRGSQVGAAPLIVVRRVAVLLPGLG